LNGWLQWAETLLASAKSPASQQDPDEAACNYYQRHVPLRLDTTQTGVWRGPQLITLDQQPYEFLKKLFELRGRPAPDLLQDFAGSGANLNTLASRLRKQIEPLSNKNIYLQNRRDRGYWLENFAL
jgi:DNA-binding response OmpR family regulator